MRWRSEQVCTQSETNIVDSSYALVGRMLGAGPMAGYQNGRDILLVDILDVMNLISSWNIGDKW